MSLHDLIHRNFQSVPRNRRQPRLRRPRPQFGRYRPRLETLEHRELPAVTVFQQGVAGYAGTQDTELSARSPDLAGDLTTVQVASAADPSGQSQGLIRFDNIFGSGANQIPPGARINAAALTLEVPLASNFNVLVHRMLVDWNESSTWNTLTGGIQTNNVEAVATPESGLTPAQGLGPRGLDVTSSVQEWAYNAAPNTVNRGWVLVMPTGNLAWQFESSELSGGRPPILAVDWTAPTPGTLNLSAATYSVSEGGGSITITVNRTDGGVGAVQANYVATSGTATVGQDFTATSGVVSFAAGQFSRTFEIPITNDALAEPDETINLTLSNPANGAVLGTQTTAVVTIVDNDGPGVLQFSAANYSVNEDAGTATITVNRVRASEGTVTVNYAATRGSALAGADFSAATGTLTFGPGVTSQTFTVSIINDIVLDPMERILLTLGSPTGGATLGSPSRAFLNINDNEPPFTFQEGAAGYAGTQDAEIRSGQATTPRGSDPTISVDLENGGSISQGLLRFDNIFGNGPNQVPLGSTIIQGILTFTATSSSDGRISVHRMLVAWDENSTWSQFGGDGIQPNNSEAAAAEDGFLFPATGTGARNITVVDALQAWSNGAPNLGWVFLNSSADGWDFAASENADPNLRPRLSVLAVPPTPGLLNFSAADTTVDEAGPTATVTVTRSGGSIGAVSVTYNATTGTATAGQDFTVATGTLNWAAGDVAPKTFTIPITNDSLVEPDETINLVLSNPTGGAGLGEDSEATATIIDNDGPGTLQFSAPTFTVNENGGAAVLTVNRTRGSVGTVTVAYAAGAGTATVGLDFTAATGVVTFGPGEASKTISIPLVDDGLDESFQETILITLSSPTGGAVLGGQASAVVTILDNERSLVLQEGLNGYAGTDDTTLRAAEAGTNLGTAGTIVADLVDADRQVQGLLRFNNLFGTGPNQILPDATIHAATLTVQVGNATIGAISLHRMLVNWTEAASTWNSLENGVQFVTEAALLPDSPATTVGGTGVRSFDVTSALRAWAGGALNMGWLFHNTTDDGWNFLSADEANGLNRPRLEVVFTAPAATTPLRLVTANPNTLTVSFNQPLDASQLNVFGSAADPLGPPDVTLVGLSGPVAGSVILNPTNAGLNAPFNAVGAFVPTGGPLAPGLYTITLRSAANGFRNLYGGLLLDGNGDGTAGDSFSVSFPVSAPAANARTVSLPNIVRGPGQAVNLPTGLPLRLSDGQGVTAVSLQIRYDPALLDLTAATAVPAGSTVTFNTNTPGLAQVSFTSPTALAAGPLEVVRLTATVRADAPYSAKHVLDLVNVSVSAGTTALPVVEDDGLHLVGYLGDVDGSGAYESADAVLLERFVTGQNVGFPAYQLADPILVGDITGDGLVNANDTTAAMQLAAGMAVPNVPPRPAVPAVPIPGGADPRLYLPADLAGAVGETVTVPVLLEVTDPGGASVTGVDVTLRYDPNRFTVGNLRLGDLLADFRASFNAEVPGELRLVAFAGRGPELAFGTSGALFLIDFTVLPGAVAGVSTLNLLASLGGTPTALYGNDVRPLTLVPAPTDGSGDAVDGRFTILALPEPEPVARPVADAAPDRNRVQTPGPDRQDPGLAALALLLGGTGARTGGVFTGDLGRASAIAVGDAFFALYGDENSDGATAVESSFAFHGGAGGERAVHAVLESLPVSDAADLFNVDALFGGLGERG
jgi:hypothetical protein